jgi:hypothetical protein
VLVPVVYATPGIDRKETETASTLWTSTSYLSKTEMDEQDLRGGYILKGVEMRVNWRFQQTGDEITDAIRDLPDIAASRSAIGASMCSNSSRAPECSTSSTWNVNLGMGHDGIGGGVGGIVATESS